MQMQKYTLRCVKEVGFEYNGTKKYLRPDDIADLAFMIYGDDGIIAHKEYFYVIAFDRSQKVIGYIKVSEGGLSSTVVEPRQVFQFALMANANALALVHNHPSGAMSASREDISLTKKLKDAAMLFDIRIIDHIIIGPEKKFYSMLSEGVM